MTRRDFRHAYGVYPPMAMLMYLGTNPTSRCGPESALRNYHPLATQSTTKTKRAVTQ